MSEFTTRDGCRIHYVDSGSGSRVLVLLPGWSQSRAMFDRLTSVLDGNFRTVSLDYRNHGESGESPKGARISTLAADLRELLGHLRIERANFLGHSMGCSVLYSYMDLFGTDSIESLVLLDQPTVCAGVPWLNAEDGAKAGMMVDFQGAYGFADTLLGPDSDAFRRGFLQSTVSPDLPAEDFEWMYAENLKTRMPYGAKLVFDHVLQDWRDVLPMIDVPVLVIGGEVSHVPASSQEWTASMIPGAQVRVLTREEGGSHFPFFEKPEVFAAVIAEFISGAERA
jgi:pimeloyl-ACP methyl ester carboxylesterase